MGAGSARLRERGRLHHRPRGRVRAERTLAARAPVARRSLVRLESRRDRAGGKIPEHDETAREQEEVYIVVSGTAVAIVDGVEYPAPAGTYVRLDPEPLRTIANAGDEPVKLLMVSAPRSSGYEPMDWA